jgi:transposase
MLAPVSTAVRLAQEGVPVAAIARALCTPYEYVARALREALEAGDIAEMPASDWPVGQRREDRAPTKKRRAGEPYR